MEKHLWQDQARRLGGEDLVSTIETMAQDLAEIRRNVQHLTSSAFPAGDIEGHRRYHEVMIETLAERRRLRIAIQEKTISALVWIVIVWTASAIWSKFGAVIVSGATK